MANTEGEEVEKTVLRRIKEFLRLDDLREAFDIFSKIKKIFSSKKRILIVGISGTGKSQFLQSLGKDYLTKVGKKTIQAKDKRVKIEEVGSFVFIDTPGHMALNKEDDLLYNQFKNIRKNAIKDFIANENHNIVGVINVTAFGFCQRYTNNELDKTEVFTDNSEASFNKDYFDKMKELEIQQIKEWNTEIMSVGDKEYFKFIITLVNKKDLWFDDFTKVQEHYTNGDYANALREAIGDLMNIHHVFYYSAAATTRFEGYFYGREDFYSQKYQKLTPQNRGGKKYFISQLAEFLN